MVIKRKIIVGKGGGGPRQTPFSRSTPPPPLPLPHTHTHIFSKITSFLEIQCVPTFYTLIGKTKVLNETFNWLFYKFYPRSILILEEYLLKR